MIFSLLCITPPKNSLMLALESFAKDNFILLIISTLAAKYLWLEHFSCSCGCIPALESQPHFWYRYCTFGIFLIELSFLCSPFTFRWFLSVASQLDLNLRGWSIQRWPCFWGLWVLSRKDRCIWRLLAGQSWFSFSLQQRVCYGYGWYYCTAILA